MDDCKKINTETISWQGFLQQILYQVSRGYFFYCYTSYPLKKREKWTSIDKKLLAKYGADISKHQRFRRKNAGKANFIILRWNEHSIILHTLGTIEDGHYDDVFHDIRKIPLVLPILGSIAFKFHRDRTNQGFTISFTRETFRDFKATLVELAKVKSPGRLAVEFSRINGFPAYYGIIVQKLRLAEICIHEAKRHGFPLAKKDLKIRTSKKFCRVFERAEE